MLYDRHRVSIVEGTRLQNRTPLALKPDVQNPKTLENSSPSISLIIYLVT